MRRRNISKILFVTVLTNYSDHHYLSVERSSEVDRMHVEIFFVLRPISIRLCKFQITIIYYSRRIHVAKTEKNVFILIRSAKLFLTVSYLSFHLVHLLRRPMNSLRLFSIIFSHWKLLVMRSKRVIYDVEIVKSQWSWVLTPQEKREIWAEAEKMPPQLS